MGEAPAREGRGLDAAWDELVEDLRAATHDTRAAERLLGVGHVCTLHVRGHDHLEVALRFDAKPPEVEEGARGVDADIDVEIPPDLVTAFWEKSLATEILKGEVAFDGPVRRLLQVYPVLRAQALARRSGEAQANGHRGTSPSITTSTEVA
ncbi:hypothetical protein [Conexibacter sp. SYSU D00693]|uniref:hypothetical protein n=1 Tax=Conexibacter sp. SYSU D00693 TaxID=2812560 RepID=UPI00196A8505|nr:hypothetical protein [Conexibacter sp. SYSU D00693]